LVLRASAPPPAPPAAPEAEAAAAAAAAAAVVAVAAVAWRRFQARGKEVQAMVLPSSLRLTFPGVDDRSFLANHIQQEYEIALTIGLIIVDGFGGR